MNKPALMKTCSICGLQKPLSAFLIITEEEGTTYGNICAACRKAQRKAIPENDESTTSTTGRTIDSKAKAHGDIDKKQQHDKTEEQYHEERDKTAEKETKRTEKIIITTEEKKQRDLQKGKQSFLERHRTTQQATEVFGGEAQTAKEKQINLAAPVLDTHHGLKEKHKGVMFNQFKSWLGGSAPIGGHAPGSHAGGEKTQTKKNQEEKNKDPLIDYIDEHWTPGSGPKRR